MRNGKARSGAGGGEADGGGCGVCVDGGVGRSEERRERRERWRGRRCHREEVAEEGRDGVTLQAVVGDAGAVDESRQRRCRPAEDEEAMAMRWPETQMPTR
ncbi:hypothetical protein GUJ93_ZPchr0001g30265 [Zizania palustris]|uniref:Uncharacterized protein n=1 Tax=Zizania palustris TaxID=103762 RepID=A0A8J5RSD7_ZIZPA|nr:hypothetical protein GUJ93_ZPchr0001g30265 [Zizania palustris]